MSTEPPPPPPPPPVPDHNSAPASTGGLFLRLVVAVGIVLAGIVGLIWYANH